MVDPLTAAAIAAMTSVLKDLATDILKDSAKDEVKGFLSRGSKQISDGTQQQLFNASRQYVETYQERHCILKVLGMREPVSLDSVYTAVRFLDGDGLRQFASAQEMEQAFRETRSRRLRQQEGKKQEGLAVANAKPYLMVLGAPGAGKSTFLRKMGLEALRGKRQQFQHRCIPVFIELKRLNTGAINLEQVIVNEFETCGFPDAKGFTRKALNQGRLLILLDGLDEVPTAQLTQAIQAIQDFVDRYDKNRYIASCRIAAYRNNFRRFSDVTMAEFEDDQIERFIRNWFRSPTDYQTQKAETCWTELQKPQAAGAKELAHTPLLLTFLCLVYDRSLSFPSNRSVLYRKALRILLEEWAAEKCLENQRQIYEGLSVELEESLLSEIAAKGFAKDQLFFSQREIVDRIKTFLASNLNAPKHLDGEKVLEAIAVQQGILVERAEDAYSFSHLTLQEHLTAQYIVDNPENMRSLVAKHLTNDNWREVFLLIAGLLPGSKGADPLLLLMEEQVRLLINTPKLKALLQWSENATLGSKENYNPVAKRTAALVLARDLDRALARNFDRDLERALTRDRDLARARDLERAFARAHDLADLACDLADLARDLARARDLDFARDLADRDLVRARDLARDLALALVRALALAREFEKIKIFQSANFTKLVADLERLQSQVPGDSQPIEARQAFANRLYQIWFDALRLDRETATLSNTEAKALANYLYACELMVRCKEAAVRVSPQTWDAIEGRMLTVAAAADR
ncbi:MAG TPA: NACHT domain-containing protein [Coleofasciculaceae cyanobacterium]|jgi:predicted NACHT family NTPase